MALTMLQVHILKKNKKKTYISQYQNAMGQSGEGRGEREGGEGSVKRGGEKQCGEGGVSCIFSCY